MISAVWGMYIHSNINVNTGRLQKFINGPEMHRWHHRQVKEETEISLQNLPSGIGFLTLPICPVIKVKYMV